MGQQARSQMLKRLSAAAYRSPILFRLAQAALNESPVLRRWVNAGSGAGSASLQSVDRNPTLLSPRAHSLYEQLEQEVARQGVSHSEHGGGQP